MEGFESFVVVVNHEEQYSIWPTELPVPDGWRPLDCRGAKDSCLAYIEQHWIDMRPLSAREATGNA